MEDTLGPLVGSGAPMTRAGTRAVATSYFLAKRGQFKQQNSIRNERELRTLALAIDAMVRGQYHTAGDIIMQRYKAVELASIEGNWRIASHLELLPVEASSAVTTAEREVASTLELREASLRARLDSNIKGGRLGENDHGD